MKSGDTYSNWPLVGNRQITEFLSKSLVNGRVAGAYIFYGPDNLGKTTAAGYFAQILLCQRRANDSPCGECPSCRKFLVKKAAEDDSEQGSSHSDFYTLKKDKEKKNISVDEVRDFIRRLSMSSFLNSYKIGVIKHAEHLSIKAANALLKTLEEPKSKVVINLIAADIDALPATIVSRSQILKFNLVGTDIIYDYLIKEHKAPRSAAKKFSRASLGRPALAVKFLEDKEFYESYAERASAFLEILPQDLNGRLGIIKDLIGREDRGQILAKKVGRIIEIWRGLARDLLLLKYEHKDLIQHQLLDKELEKISGNLRVEKLLNLEEVMAAGEEYLESNVNPKLVLENIVISI